MFSERGGFGFPRLMYYEEMQCQELGTGHVSRNKSDTHTLTHTHTHRETAALNKILKSPVISSLQATKLRKCTSVSKFEITECVSLSQQLRSQLRRPLVIT